MTAFCVCLWVKLYQFCLDSLYSDLRQLVPYLIDVEVIFIRF
jgi:hypothetical protein